MGEQSMDLKDNGNSNNEQENMENDPENMSEEETDEFNDITPEGKVSFPPYCYFVNLKTFDRIRKTG